MFEFEGEIKIVNENKKKFIVKNLICIQMMRGILQKLKYH